MCPIRSHTEVCDRTGAIVRRAQLVVLPLIAQWSKRAGKGSRVHCVLAVWPIVLTPSPKRHDRDDRPVSVFGATRDGDTEIDWADASDHPKVPSALPALAFCLLFCFQGAIGSARTLTWAFTHGEGSVGRWCLALPAAIASVERVAKL
jgi:hypothetical protein